MNNLEEAQLPPRFRRACTGIRHPERGAQSLDRPGGGGLRGRRHRRLGCGGAYALLRPRYYDPATLYAYDAGYGYAYAPTMPTTAMAALRRLCV